MNQAGRKPKQNQSRHDAFAPLNDLTQSLVSRTYRARAMLSPWVQRVLQERPEPAETVIGIGRRRQTALSEQHTRTFLDGVSRKVENSKVWRPDVGSLEPALVDRFASEIVGRFPTTGARYETQPLEMASAETTDLILPGMQPSTEGEASSLKSETGSVEPPRFPSMADLQGAMAARSRWGQAPSGADRPGRDRPSSQIQRAASESPGPGQPTRVPPPASRLFSKVEEVSPSGKTSTRVRSSGEPPTRIESFQADEPPDLATDGVAAAATEEEEPPELETRSTKTLDRPAPTLEPSRPVESSPPVQRQLDQDAPDRTQPPLAETEEIEPAQPETAPPLVEVESPGLPDRQEVVSDRSDESPLPPVVQQPLDQEMPVQAEPHPAEVEKAEPVQPEPPTVQPQLDREIPVQTQPRLAQVEEIEPQPEPPAPSPVEVEPPSPPASREVEPDRPEIAPEPRRSTEPPVVQRQVDREMPVRVQPRPAQVEKVEADRPETPLAKVEPPSLPVSEEVEPDRPELEPETSRPIGPQQPDQDMPIRARPRPIQVEEVEPDQPELPISSLTEVGTEPAAVQRQIDQDIPDQVQPRPPEVEAVEPDRPEPPAPSLVEAEPSGLPASEEATFDRPEIAPESSRPARPPVQRQFEPEIGLAQDILARGVSKARLPLSEPLRPEPGLARTKPLEKTAMPRLPQVQVQARFEDEEGGKASTEPLVINRFQTQAPTRILSRLAVTPPREPILDQTLADELPLPPVRQPVSAEAVQRQAMDSPDLAMTPQKGDVVQRVAETPPETGETPAEESPEPDLNRLARQVYPFVKQILAVERERRSL